MESGNFVIVLVSVFIGIGTVFLGSYKLYFEKIKTDNDTLKTENDSLKIELEKQKIVLEKLKIEQDEKNRKDDQEQEKLLRRIEHDKIIFQKVMEVLPSNAPSIILVKERTLNIFPSKELSSFLELIYNLDSPEYIFLDTELESKRGNLYKLIKDFIHYTTMNTYPHENNSSYQCIPPEWKSNNSELYKETLDTLHQKANDLFDVYKDFVEFSKKQLH